MSRIAYVNGRYVPQSSATVHIEDRGYQFADGIYEVIAISNGALIDEGGHLARLQRSLSELSITPPASTSTLGLLMRETIRRNRCTEGFVYLQITRGVARRDHVPPDPAVKPALVITVRHTDAAKASARAAAGIKVISTPDLRWRRPDIKSIALLPNVMAKAAAKAAGASEAWLLDSEGFVTEGASTNAWIVTSAGTIVSHPTTSAILHGITRTTLVKAIAGCGYLFEERPFALSEALAAMEAFSTGATTLVTPVIAIDGHPVGTGQPGPVAERLGATFHAYAQRSSSRAGPPRP